MVITRSRTRKQTVTPIESHSSSTKSRKRRIDKPTIASPTSTLIPTTRLSDARPATIPQPPGLPFSLLPAQFGLIQERIRGSLYALVVQAILWNQTRGLAARPVLFDLLTQYPDPAALAQASVSDLSRLLQPIGLQHLRATRLVALGQTWGAAPPCKERRYRRVHYPVRGAGLDIKPNEILGIEDPREGWEIAHLPGVGPYALDSFRIFYRDVLRGCDESSQGDDHQPEWKTVKADDKDLKAYLQWRWAMEP